MKLMRVAFALLIFSASSGVTTLVHTCAVAKMDCCAPMSSSKQDSCDASASPISGILLKADITCHTNTLVGGVAIKLALVEKEHQSRQNTTPVACIDPSSLGFSSTNQNPSQYQFALAVPHSPPSVEKYVLNGSLLI